MLNMIIVTTVILHSVAARVSLWRSLFLPITKHYLTLPHPLSILFRLTQTILLTPNNTLRHSNMKV